MFDDRNVEPPVRLRGDPEVDGIMLCDDPGIIVKDGVAFLVALERLGEC